METVYDREVLLNPPSARLRVFLRGRDITVRAQKLQAGRWVYICRHQPWPETVDPLQGNAPAGEISFRERNGAS